MKYIKQLSVIGLTSIGAAATTAQAEITITNGNLTLHGTFSKGMKAIWLTDGDKEVRQYYNNAREDNRRFQLFRNGQITPYSDDGRNWIEEGDSIVQTVDGIKIKNTLSKGPNNGILVTFTMTNTTSQSVNIGFSDHVDTMLNGNDNVPLKSLGNGRGAYIINGEYRLEYIMNGQNGPDKAKGAKYDDYKNVPNGKIMEPEGTSLFEGDTGIHMYWDEKPLAPGATRTMSYEIKMEGSLNVSSSVPETIYPDTPFVTKLIAKMSGSNVTSPDKKIKFTLPSGITLKSNDVKVQYSGGSTVTKTLTKEGDKYVLDFADPSKLTRADETVTVSLDTLADSSLANKTVNGKATLFIGGNTDADIKFTVKPSPAGTVTEVEKEPVPFTTKEIEDPTLNSGESRVDREGVDGEVTVTKVWKTLNNQKVGDPTVTKTTTKQMVEKLVRVGTGGSVTETEVKPIDYDTKYIDDENLQNGQEVVQTEGKQGVRTIKKTWKTVKGVKQGEPTVDDQITTPKVDKVVRRGNAGEVTDSRKEPIPFATEIIEDETLPEGTEKVTVEGVTGEREFLTTYKTVKGQKVGNPIRTSFHITKEVVTKIIHKGVKGSKTEVENVEIPYTTKIVEDENLPLGTRKTVQQGQKGTRTITRTWVTHRKLKVGDPEVSEKVSKQPVEEIIHVGLSENVRDEKYEPIQNNKVGADVKSVNGQFGQKLVVDWYKIAKGKRMSDVKNSSHLLRMSINEVKGEKKPVVVNNVSVRRFSLPPKIVSSPAFETPKYKTDITSRALSVLRKYKF